MKGFFKEFGKFIQKGNVMDMAVGVVIGTAFSAIITSLVDDIIMPLIAIPTGKVNFTDLTLTLGKTQIAYGSFIQAVVNFIIIAFCIFCVVKAMNKFTEKLKKKEEKEEEKKKDEQVVLLEEIRDLLKKHNK